MPREHTEDEQLAKQFNCAPEEIATARERLSRDTLLQKIIHHDLAKHIESLRTTLETVSDKDLRDVQGQIKGVRSARALVVKTP